jgi:hypothetical protein
VSCPSLGTFPFDCRSAHNHLVRQFLCSSSSSLFRSP